MEEVEKEFTLFGGTGLKAEFTSAVIWHFLLWEMLGCDF